MEKTTLFAKSWISEITFHDGTTLDLNQDSIVVIVGANNCGKTQTLRDVHSLILSDTSGKVVESLKYNISEAQHLKYDLEDFAERNNYGYQYYGKLINDQAVKKFTDKDIISGEGLRDFLYSFHKTEDRLMICNPREMGRRYPQDTSFAFPRSKQSISDVSVIQVSGSV